MRPREAAVMPLPSEEATPPVTNTNFGTTWTSGVFSMLLRSSEPKKAHEDQISFIRSETAGCSAQQVAAGRGRCAVGRTGPRRARPAGNHRAVHRTAAFGDDALESVLGDNVEEGLAVIVEVLGHREDPRAEAGSEKTRAPIGQPASDQGASVLIQQVEGDEDRPAAAFRGFRAEPAREKVVARAAARVADDDLAVDQHALRKAHVAKLREEPQQIAA